MGIAARLSLITAFILAAVLGGMFLLMLNVERQSLGARQQAELSAVGLLMRETLDRTSGFALSQAETLARQPEVRQALIERDRMGLSRRLADTFAFLRGEMGVEVMQFHQDDFRMLLRMQDVTRFGEDASVSRPIVVAANRGRRSQRGVEIGPTGVLALRGVAPVVQGETLIGTAEVGLALAPLLQSIKSATGAEVAVVLAAGLSGPSQRQADVAVYASTDSLIFASLIASPDFRLARDRVQFEAEASSERYAVVAEPLLDFSGRMIGAVVGARPAGAAVRAFDRTVLILAFSALAGVVVAYSVLKISINALLIRPLEALAERAERLAAGEVTTTPVGGAQEIMRAAKAFEVLAARKEPAQ
jgi:HAMP domain-containing protein